MVLNKQNLVYSILIVFSVFVTGILSDDCELYKKLVGNTFPYKDDIEKYNGFCCRANNLVCDEQNNITSMSFFFELDCGLKSLFEQLVNFQHLDTLDIDVNEDIPSEVGKVKNLKKLVIKIPFYTKGKSLQSAIGELTNLEELTFSDSNLVGEIPSSFGNLVNLRKLDLSDNHLEGYIPYEFKNLKNLENLNLSGNLIKGYVPLLPNLSQCYYDYTQLCPIKSSRCTSNLKECTTEQIKEASKNNGNPNPDAIEEEIEKEIEQYKSITKTTTNNNNNNNKKGDTESKDSSTTNDYSNKNKKPSSFSSFFYIIIIIIIGLVAFLIYQLCSCSNSKKNIIYNDNDNDNDDNDNDNNRNNNNTSEVDDDNIIEVQYIQHTTVKLSVNNSNNNNDRNDNISVNNSISNDLLPSTSNDIEKLLNDSRSSSENNDTTTNNNNTNTNTNTNTSNNNNNDYNINDEDDDDAHVDDNKNNNNNDNKINDYNNSSNNVNTYNNYMYNGGVYTAQPIGQPIVQPIGYNYNYIPTVPNSYPVYYTPQQGAPSPASPYVNVVPVSQAGVPYVPVPVQQAAPYINVVPPAEASSSSSMPTNTVLPNMDEKRTNNNMNDNIISVSPVDDRNIVHAVPKS